MNVDSPAGNRLNGCFRGEVVQHLTHGYCKIFIPSIYPEEWKEKPELLPPAEQASSLFAGVNNGSGEFTYPNIGSIVWLMFANGDQNYPVYFASSLGGENAFGQYEHIKQPNEQISERHMITSGKTHIQWYENGKLSVIVVDPDRRDAEVDYNNSYIGQISDDAVSARPIVEKVVNEEISSIDCQLVLDNHEYNGTISCGTHHFDLKSYSNTQNLTAEQKVIIEKYNSEERYDTTNVTQNDSLHQYTAISSFSGDQSITTQDMKMSTTIQVKNKDSEEFQTTFTTDGQANISLASENTKSNNDLYISQNTATNENKTKSLVQELYIGNAMELDQDGNGCFQTIRETDYNLLKNNCPDTATKSMKFNSEDSVVYKGGNVSFNNLSSVQRYVDTARNIVMLTAEVDNSLKFKNADGSYQTSKYNFQKVAAVTEIQKNEQSQDFDNTSGAKQFTKAYGFKNVAGSILYDTTYEHEVKTNGAKVSETLLDNFNKVSFKRIIDDANEGKFEISITNMSSGKSSLFRMDKDGNITLTGSSNLKILIGEKSSLEMDKSGSIKIISPNNDIKIIGNVDISGSLHVTKDIIGDMDIAASNCTMNTHTHTENQAGDVIVPGQQTSTGH